MTAATQLHENDKKMTPTGSNNDQQRRLRYGGSGVCVHGRIWYEIQAADNVRTSRLGVQATIE